MTFQTRVALRSAAAILVLATGGLIQTEGAHAASKENLEQRSLFGSYLSGRLASRQREMDAAAGFYKRALSRDPKNNEITKQALRAELAVANWERAGELARAVVAKDDKNRLGRLFLGLEAFKSGKTDDARVHFGKAAAGPIGELSAALSTAWSHAKDKNLDKAYEALDVLKKAKWAQFYRLYHRALIAEHLGDTVVARAAFGELFRGDQRMLRLTLAYARHAAKAGDFKLARGILRKHLKTVNDIHPLARALQADIRDKKSVTSLVDNPAAGMAEVFYGLGEALTGEGGVDIGAIYLQYGLYSRGSFPMALMTLGSVYEATRRYPEAIDSYARIPADSPLFFNGEVRRAINLNQLDKFEESRAALSDLVERFKFTEADAGAADEDNLVKRVQMQLAQLGLYTGAIDGLTGPAYRRAVKAFQRAEELAADGVAGPTTQAVLEAATTSADAAFKRERALRALLTLGTVLRGKEKFKDAAEVYSRAIALIKRPTRRHWRYFYSRGVSYERLGDWPKAETDLKKAMALNPDQPLILNYLGYSWVDQNKNLKVALDLIKKAVKVKPDDGYFVDSLGWAYYRQSKFAEATKYLERAVELRPDDPTINDHLGDAYWHVGRLLEARYQWRQSLSLEPEEKDAVKIRRKLERGLPDGKSERVAGQADDKTKKK